MITVIPYADLGHVNMGWLDARYHFSFGEYTNRHRMKFKTLRVVNDDIIAAGTGFETHGHKDMEIITYVSQGAIHHADSLGNKGVTKAGDVQVMTVGSGIEHSEAADPNEETRCYQIWIRPRELGVTPRWAQRKFSKVPVQDRLNLLVSGYEAHKDSGALPICQDAAIYGGKLSAGTSFHQQLPSGDSYVLIAEGDVVINGKNLNKGDGAEITEDSLLVIEALTDAEVLVICL